MADKSTAELELLITAQTKQFEKELNGVQKQLANVSAQAKKAEGIGAGFKAAIPSINGFTVGLAAAGAALGFVKGGIDKAIALDSELRNIGTLGIENYQAFGDKVLEISKTVPQSAVQLSKGVYQAISAGVSEAAAASFVETAAKAGVAGLADTETAVNALTSVINAYKMEASDATLVSDQMFMAVKLGKTSFSEINAGLAAVVPAASAASVGFSAVAASIATMTKQGVPTAQATTQLRQVIIELQKPSKDLAEAMKQAGIENGAAALKTLGLHGTLQKLQESAAGSGKSMTQVFSSAEAASAALLLTGENAQMANADLEAMNNSAGAMGDAFDVNGASAANRMILLTNKVDALQTKIGQTLLPVLEGVTNGLDSIVNAVNDTIAAFENFNMNKIGEAMTDGIRGFFEYSTFGLSETALGWVGLGKEVKKTSEVIADSATKAQAATGAILEAADTAATSFGRTPKIVKQELEEAQKAYDETGDKKLIPKIKKLTAELDKLMAPFSKGEKKKESPLKGTLGAMEAELNKLQTTITSRLAIGSDAFLVATAKANSLRKEIQAMRAAFEAPLNISAMTVAVFGLAGATDRLTASVQAYRVAQYSESGEEEITRIMAAEEAYRNLITSVENTRSVTENLEPVFATLGESIAAGVSGGADAMKQGLKALLNSILDFINAQYIAAGAAVALRALISGGLSAFVDVSGYAAASIAVLAARAAINSFAVGTDYVTKDQLAMVHKGEMIIPKTFAEGVRSGEVAVTGTQSTNTEPTKRKGPSKIKTPTMHISAFRSNVNQAAWETSRGFI